ncbi:LemA family protein [Candidatus Gottesmanbacteria bacterium]|nr:LemA family protein [Candidatus Gottesmanbacteria bacterium]
MNPIFVIGGIVILTVVYFWSLYNGLVRESTEIDEAGAQIDVQLKRRSDLIPNLVETVKGYAKHEKSVFAEVTRARSALMSAKSLPAKAKADDMLTGALKSLFAVAEAYPQLRANENFVQLQKELSDTEDKIAYARQYYNTQLMELNLKVKTFPNNLFADKLGFKERQFFKASDEDRKKVSVNFE